MKQIIIALILGLILGVININPFYVILLIGGFVAWILFSLKKKPSEYEEFLK